MANHYCETSSMYAIPEVEMDGLRSGKEGAESVIKEVRENLEENEGMAAFKAEVVLHEGGRGVWIYSDESADPEHIEALISALQEHFKDDKPFIFSWSYSCSKPRINEFGGGACVVKRGRDTRWIDAVSQAEDIIALEGWMEAS